MARLPGRRVDAVRSASAVERARRRPAVRGRSVRDDAVAERDPAVAENVRAETGAVHERYPSEEDQPPGAKISSFLEDLKRKVMQP